MVIRFPWGLVSIEAWQWITLGHLHSNPLPWPLGQCWASVWHKANAGPLCWANAVAQDQCWASAAAQGHCYHLWIHGDQQELLAVVSCLCIACHSMSGFAGCVYWNDVWIICLGLAGWQLWQKICKRSVYYFLYNVFFCIILFKISIAFFFFSGAPQEPQSGWLQNIYY